MATTGSRLGLSVTASNVSIECLIDTGACVSLLRHDKFRDICLVNGRSRLLQPAPQLLNVSGKPIRAIGKTEVEFSHLGTLPVVVVEGILHECILGHDALVVGRSVLDYEARTLQWRGRRFAVHPYVTHGKYGDTLTGTGSGVATPVVVAGLDCQDVPEEYQVVVHECEDVFYTEGKSFGQCPLTEVTIDTGDSPPIRQRPYRTPLAKRKIVDECIDQMLQDGVIYPSSSPWASPVCLVPKKDGTTRFCVDYRRLNEVTVKDRYPLPLIQDIFDQLGETVYLVCNLKAAYNQLRVVEYEQDNTAFICHRGFFNFRVGSFGLVNMPSIFQCTMEMALSDLQGRCVWVFIDDLEIASDSVESHQRDLEAVFAYLCDAKLHLKASK